MVLNFSEILDSSVDTLRFSIDESKSIVKWSTINNPVFIQNLSNYDGPYTHSQILGILNSEVWIESYNEEE